MKEIRNVIAKMKSIYSDVGKLYGIKSFWNTTRKIFGFFQKFLTSGTLGEKVPKDASEVLGGCIYSSLCEVQGACMLLNNDDVDPYQARFDERPKAFHCVGMDAVAGYPTVGYG